MSTTYLTGTLLLAVVAGAAAGGILLLALPLLPLAALAVVIGVAALHHRAVRRSGRAEE
ncbi:hypothetical protein [Saccharopolyspora elongata]|uniref:hypothetical protein n=1 Tax=Saccharopolyspora elongata TaxID=2530387 RepID=UPI0014044D54|nr:hypothetical protein [Saccharopolyspora elongata]